jgi:hypothetical protein
MTDGFATPDKDIPCPVAVERMGANGRPKPGRPPLMENFGKTALLESAAIRVLTQELTVNDTARQVYPDYFPDFTTYPEREDDRIKYLRKRIRDFVRIKRDSIENIVS